MLPTMTEESRQSSSKVIDPTHSPPTETRRTNNSKALASHNSVEAVASETNLPEREQIHEHEKSVQFETMEASVDFVSG